MTETCNELLRANGKPYPRTCRECGLGPCKQAKPARVEQESTVAIYVDGASTYRAGLEAARREHAVGRPDYEQIALEAVKVAAEDMGVDWRTVRVRRQRIYVVSQSVRTLGFQNVLERLGYEVRSHILKSKTDTFSWDVEVATDVLGDLSWDGLICPELTDRVVLVTGNGNFAPLVESLDKRGLVLNWSCGMSSRFSADRTRPLGSRHLLMG